MAALTRRFANNVVEWDDIRAMKANKLVALDKCPGVQPIGIGDAADRGLCKGNCTDNRRRCPARMFI